MPAPALPTVNAWQACETYCAPFPTALAQMDSPAHLGCLCAIPPKRLEEPKPESWRYIDPRSRPAVLGPLPWTRPVLRRAGQEYGEPIPSPPPEPDAACHLECGRKHCEDWLRCGRTSENLEQCRKRVGKEHERCHKRCDPGIG